MAKTPKALHLSHPMPSDRLNHREGTWPAQWPNLTSLPKWKCRGAGRNQSWGKGTRNGSCHEGCPPLHRGVRGGSEQEKVPFLPQSCQVLKVRWMLWGPHLPLEPDKVQWKPANLSGLCLEDICTVQPWTGLTHREPGSLSSHSLFVPREPLMGSREWLSGRPHAWHV